MNAFTRSAAGLNNIRHFYDAQFNLYIEGKKPASSPQSAKTADFHFYSNLLKKIRPNTKFKIHILGNKKTVLAYAKKLRDNNTSHSIVIVDKDLEGVISSHLPLSPIITTYGYSWENELWSINTVSAILHDLTNTSPISQLNPAISLTKIAKRLKYISALDAGAQTSGKNILPKTSNLCGVNVVYPSIPIKEISRISDIYRSTPAYGCSVSSGVIKIASKKPHEEIIQGHFWSNVAQGYIRNIYKKITGDSFPSKSVLLNLALSYMRKDTINALGPHVIHRYDAEFAKLGI